MEEKRLEWLLRMALRFNDEELLEQACREMYTNNKEIVDVINHNVSIKSSKHAKLIAIISLGALDELVNKDVTPNKQREAVKSGEFKIAQKVTEAQVYESWVEFSGVVGKTDRIQQMAKALSVDPMTIRRNLKKLAKKGLVEYGRCNAIEDAGDTEEY